MSDDCYNLTPLLSGGRVNRTKPLLKFEFPQRFIRPAVWGGLAGVLCIGVDALIGGLFTDWRVLAVAVLAGRWWYRRRVRAGMRPDRARWWLLIVSAAWAAFVIAGLLHWAFSAAPLLNMVLPGLTWPMMGATVGVLSVEARSATGATRFGALLSQGRSGAIGGRLHLGLWPVPDADRAVRWCDGARPNIRPGR